MKEKGAIAIVAPLFILVIIAVVIYILISRGFIKTPLKSLTPSSKEPTVSLQTQYQNPFDKNAQYVNPFSEYKNPFDTIKK